MGENKVGKSKDTKSYQDVTDLDSIVMVEITFELLFNGKR